MAVATRDGKSDHERPAERDARAVFQRSAAKLANLITLIRLLTVFPLLWLIASEQFAFAFWVMVFAGVTDGLDGFIARYFDGRSELGALLDPLADKTLLNGIYIALALVAMIPSWLAALVVGRDILIVLGALLIRHCNPIYQPRPLLVGKLNTFAQIVLVVCMLAHLSGYLALAEQIDALIVGVALTTLISGVSYAVQGLKTFRATQSVA